QGGWSSVIFWKGQECELQGSIEEWRGARTIATLINGRIIRNQLRIDHLHQRLLTDQAEQRLPRMFFVVEDALEIGRRREPGAFSQLHLELAARPAGVADEEPQAPAAVRNQVLDCVLGGREMYAFGYLKIRSLDVGVQRHKHAFAGAALVQCAVG